MKKFLEELIDWAKLISAILAIAFGMIFVFYLFAGIITNLLAKDPLGIINLCK